MIIKKILISIVLAGCFHTPAFQVVAYYDEPIPPYKGEGPFVEKTAVTGLYIGGAVGGSIGMVAFPMVLMVGSIANMWKDVDVDPGPTALIFFYIPAAIGGYIGQHTLGAPCYMLKKILYDAPKGLLRVVFPVKENIVTNN